MVVENSAPIQESQQASSLLITSCTSSAATEGARPPRRSGGDLVRVDSTPDELQELIPLLRGESGALSLCWNCRAVARRGHRGVGGVAAILVLRVIQDLVPLPGGGSGALWAVSELSGSELLGSGWS